MRLAESIRAMNEGIDLVLEEGGISRRFRPQKVVREPGGRRRVIQGLLLPHDGDATSAGEPVCVKPRYLREPWSDYSERCAKADRLVSGIVSSRAKREKLRDQVIAALRFGTTNAGDSRRASALTPIYFDREGLEALLRLAGHNG